MTNATYKLSAPIEFRNETFSSLTFRKLKAKDLAAADAVEGQVKKSLAILASMAGVPFQVIGELEIEDLEGAQEVAAPFMGKSAIEGTQGTPAQTSAE